MKCILIKFCKYYSSIIKLNLHNKIENNLLECISRIFKCFLLPPSKLSAWRHRMRATVKSFILPFDVNDKTTKMLESFLGLFVLLEFSLSVNISICAGKHTAWKQYNLILIRWNFLIYGNVLKITAQED